jgi:hypothetical protein
MTKTKKEKEKTLELGDIVSVDAPTNPEWHQQVFFISYIDNEIIEVIHTESSFSYVWNQQTDIKKITILERSSLKGYAKQNGLYPHIWIDIYFGGETPRSLTAEITNLEEDMIELTTYPENQVLYIDFAYQGIPRHLPIVKICVREKPASFRRGVFSPEDEDEAENKGEASMEYLENGFINIVLPTQYKPDENYHDHLQKIYDMEEEGEELEEIVQQLEIPPEQQHFGLEAQVNDLLDAFLSTIPDYKRTPTIMNRIYIHIQRFQELREKYSVFDPIYHQITGIKRPLEKPIANRIAELHLSLPWIIPVVSQKKKIFYDNEDASAGDVFLSRADEMKEPELIQINQDTEYTDEIHVENETFYHNNVPQTTVKYANMHLQTAMYESAFETYPEFGIHTSLVNTDMDVLISNDTSLYSKTIGEERIYSKRFVFQRYNKEITYVKSRGKENASFATLYPADSLSFRSLFLLPPPFIAFSKIKLPNTSILSKSQLNMNYPYYFALLNKKTHVIEKEIDLGNDNDLEIKSAFQHVYLSANDETAASMDSIDKINAFLQRAIPSLPSIVETYLNKQKDVFSFIQAVDRLEPFLIYIEDIPWKTANEIKQLLYKNIDRYNTETALKSELFKTLLLENYKLEGNNEWKNEKVTEKYEKKEASTVSEWINYLLNYDQGRFYWNHLKRENLELYVPDFLLPEIENENEEDKEDSKKCWKRVIAKKYVNFNDLKEDNNKPLFFDKALDTTDYSLVANDKKEDEDEFMDYWTQTLTAKYGYTAEHALKEAQILFKGEKPIVDGDYAVLEQTPNLPSDLDQMSEEEQKEIALESNVKKRTMFFIRKNNTWVHEPDLDEYSFMDSTDLLCNIDPKCVSQKGACASDTELLNRFKNLDREKIRKEFESRYDLSKEDFSKKYEKEETYLIEWLEQELKLRQHIKTFVDYKAFEYGKRAVLQEFIESPFVPLRNSILQKHLDFVTKQKYIVLFVEKFCREPMVEEPMRESEHWKYCKETNTKLMPTSLFRLAKAYSEDLLVTNTIPVQYNAVLNQLCNTVGKLSDDGDAYIDKHSGYILRKIEMREEGFEIGFGDEGEGGLFQDSEPKMSEAIIKQIAKNEVVKIYTNEIDQRLYNMISAICRNIYVYGEENKERMMQLCSQWLKIGSFFPSEPTYKSQVDKIMKKRENDPKIKIPDTYAVYIKKKHILIATLSVLIIVQTAIPEIPIDRTFSGCVKSFDGYPLKDGQDDLSSITYFACVLKKMYVSKEDASLLPKGKGELENVLLKTLKDPILLQPGVLNLYDLKRNYLLENPVSLLIPRALEIEQKWPHFLPPITPFKVPAKLIEAISKEKQSVLNLYQVKIRTCSLAVVQYIREMVFNKNILFQTKTGFPFLQNACCDEIIQFPPKSVLEYFFEDPAIEKMVGILKNLSLHISKMQSKIKAGTVQKNFGTESISSTRLTDEKNKRNVIYSYEPILYYATLIHYCKLNSEIYPIPPELETFCNRKPTEMSTDIYDPKSSILEKMHFLEKHQVKMDAVKTIDLLNIINQRNSVEIIQTIDISHIQKIQSSLDRFIEINSDLPSLDPYMTFLQENDFKTANVSLKNQLLSFIARNASVKLTPDELNAAVKPLYFYNQDIPIQNLTKHMKSIIYRFGIIYPCFLQKTIVRKGMPLYWELLPEDTYYLFKNTKTYFDILQPFVKNPLILPIFQNCVERIRPLLEYIEYSLFSEDYYELGIFIIHGIFSIWIALMNHPDIYKTVTRNVRDNLENDQEENRLRTESNSQLMVDEIEEVDITSIQIEQRDEIKQSLADLFLLMFTTIQTKKQINAKEAVMMSYADIMKEVDFSKDREKQRLKERFKKMSTDERKAENVLKKLHLGDFAVDMKNINKYGKTDLLGDRDEDEVEVEVEEDEVEVEDEDVNIDAVEQDEDMRDMNEYAYNNTEGNGDGDEE